MGIQREVCEKIKADIARQPQGEFHNGTKTPKTVNEKEDSNEYEITSIEDVIIKEYDGNNLFELTQKYDMDIESAKEIIIKSLERWEN